MRTALIFLVAIACGSAHAQSGSDQRGSDRRASDQRAPDESDPMVAAIIFYSQSYAIERLQKWCETERPASAQSIQAAREEWDRVHEPLWEKVPGILQTRLSKDERMAVAVEARRENDKIVATLAAAPREERASWCREAPDRILSDQLDLMQRPTLVRAITGS